MAQYKVGDRILSQEEYDEDKIQKWGFALFIIGAVLCGIAAHASIPAEWAKVVKFGLILLSGMIGGTILAYFAKQIEALAGWCVVFGFLFVVGWAVWSFI